MHVAPVVNDMLNEEDNQRLTQVGPGTPMGDLLRRYWHPVAAVGELDEHPTRPVRLLGEDLVLYKCADGSYGLLDRFCAHRLTDLAYGAVEDCALRCPRHGWLYTDTGHCIDQPFEEELVEVKLTAYQAQAMGGIVWAYLGPLPAPLIPDWEPFNWQDGLIQVVLSVLHCNWLQCQENTMDGLDMELVEAAFREAARTGTPPPLPRTDFGFEEFEHGFVVRDAEASDDAAPAVTKTSIWPNGLFSGDSRSCRLEWRVPMDDTTTLNVAWFIDRVAPGAEPPPEPRIVHWFAQVRDEETGEALKSHVLNQKFAIWLNQAPIVDRTRENLSAGDEGVIMLRNKLFSQMALIADGGEPKGIIRNPAGNRALPLPHTRPVIPEALARPPGSEAAAFPYLAGQPEEIAETYRKVVETWQADAKDG